MKKKTVTCIVVSASVLVVALFFVFLSFLKNLTNPVDYNYGAQSYPYMVQEYNGKIGVFPRIAASLRSSGVRGRHPHPQRKRTATDSRGLRFLKTQNVIRQIVCLSLVVGN